jgi:hypothetical protein
LAHLKSKALSILLNYHNNHIIPPYKLQQHCPQYYHLQQAAFLGHDKKLVLLDDAIPAPEPVPLALISLRVETNLSPKPELNI